MQTIIINFLINTVLSQIIKQILTVPQLKTWGDSFLDWIEKAVKDSSTPWDDRVVVPLIVSFRATMGLPTSELYPNGAPTSSTPGIADQLITIIMRIVQEFLTSDNLKSWGDSLLDFIEGVVTNTSTPWDDTVVLPIISFLRTLLGIPKNATGGLEVSKITLGSVSDGIAMVSPFNTCQPFVTG